MGLLKETQGVSLFGVASHAGRYVEEIRGVVKVSPEPGWDLDMPVPGCIQHLQVHRYLYQ
jgi:hypothetical protein